MPGLIYRSRLSPEPYVIEFVSDETTSIAGRGILLRARVRLSPSTAA